MLLDHDVQYHKFMSVWANGDDFLRHDVADPNRLGFLTAAIDDASEVYVIHFPPDVNMLGAHEQQDVIHGEHADQLAAVIQNHHTEYPAPLLGAGLFKDLYRLTDRGLRGYGMEPGVHNISGDGFHESSLTVWTKFFQKTGDLVLSLLQN